MTAAVARVNSFDLLGADGWQMLTEDIATDFPFLSLADVNSIMGLGRKGKLDTGRSQPLNYTRIYKWVEQRAVFTLGYWQMKHPVLLGWADVAGITADLLAEIDGYETPAVAFALPYKMRQLLQTVARRACFPAYKAADYYITPEMRQQYPEGAARYEHIQFDLYPAFAEQHPEEASQNTPLF